MPWLPMTARHTPARLALKIEEIVGALQLDLRGRQVVTEAATGVYAVTPLIAALAGAEVTALTHSSRFGSVEDVRRETVALAAELAVADRIRIVEALAPEDLARADVVTNSGHVRPLDRAKVEHMKPGSVIPLMYESWELRPGEVDVETCRRRRIHVAGTNERHPQLRVFDYLGMLAVLGLLRCGVPVPFARIFLLSQNPFASFIARTLAACQADVTVLEDTELSSDLAVRRARGPGDYDALVVADTPGLLPVLGRAGAAKHSVEHIGRIGALVQVWGDVDRTALPPVACYPELPPPKGHMGILLSELGPEPIVRLQAGGLKVGEVLTSASPSADALQFCQLI